MVHLASEGAPACEHLDEQLAHLAHTYRATYFLRCPVRRRAAGAGGGAAAALQGALGLAALPALVAFRGGAVVGRAPVAQFGGGADIIEEEVRNCAFSVGRLVAFFGPFPRAMARMGIETFSSTFRPKD